MTIAITILAFLIMLVGLLGSVLPILPGLPIIWLTYLGYGFFDHWESYGLKTMIITAIIVVLSFVLDQLATVWGAKKFGAGKAGMIGSVIGGITGLIVFNLPGLIIGAFGGAAVFEMLFNRRELKQALSAGAGALIGLLCGGLGKFVIGSILIMTWVWLLL
ncbi:MAG: DUF456 domain-containing protein [Deltaproteobacteria bacterium]|jgi:uncharacterized protein YqgC (DUF456 family)|nr:DUF456 domain-containing protein [Deltaproteobacteria bacterium]